jgi:predicted DNA-binding transcriptional regulator YafY
VEERLFSVVLALLATENGLTNDDILQSVQGYRQRYVAGSGNASLERQFERDKDDLRDLGIPLETFDDPDDPGNNHALRYRIPKREYDIPRDVSFTPEEMTLLTLAATVWQQGSLSAQSRRALTKLRGIGAEPSDPLIGVAPRLTAREPAFEPLSRALERHTTVRFSYLKPGDDGPSERTVEPHALVQHQGRWHLYGYDRSAGAPRTFLLTRIAGDVTLTSEVFEAPPGDPAKRALGELEELWLSQTARVTVTAGTEADLQLARRAVKGSETAQPRAVHYTDLHAFADQLAGFGPEVVVSEPAALRDAVTDRLRRVLAAHRGFAPGRPSGPGRAKPYRTPVAPTRAGDTLVLLLALVPYLLEQGEVAVSEAAAHFRVSEERIRAAVRLIAVSGIPGQTHQYLPGDLFDISWEAFEDDDRIVLTHLVAIDEAPRFSAREAAALIAGLQYLQSWTGGAHRRASATLMAKLARSSPTGPSPVAVDAPGATETIGQIRSAIAEATQVEFDYLTVQGERSRRTVDPLRLDSVDQIWYLRAWCHTRQAVRTFRLERMANLLVTTSATTFRPGQVRVPEGLFDDAATDFTLDVDVDEGSLPMIADYLDSQLPVELAGGVVRAHLRAAHLHGIKRLVTGLGGRARVVAPENARRVVGRWAQGALKRYDAAPADSGNRV